MSLNTPASALPLAIGWFINSLAYSIIYPFLPIYLSDIRQIPMEKVGLIFPLMAVGSMIGPILAGHLVDRFGRRKILLGGTSWRGGIFLFLTVCALFDAPFWFFAIALLVNACVGAFFQNASDAYLTDITTAAQRPKAYSIIRIGTNIGWGIGPVIGALLASWPFWVLFLLTALLCYCGCMFLARSCPEPIHHAEKNEKTVSTPFDLKAFFSNTPCLFILACSGMLYLLVSQLFSVLPYYAVNHLDIPQSTLGLVLAANGLTIVCAQLPVTWVMTRWKILIENQLFLGALLYSVGFLCVADASDGLVLAGCITVITLGETVVQPAIYMAISRFAQRGAIGRYMGILGLVRGIGYAFGPYIGLSLLYPKFADTPMLFWGLVALPGILAMIGFAFLGGRKYQTIRQRKHYLRYRQ